MPSLVTQTREKLSKLASPEEFEVLATAVLRAAVPAYASLIHVGMNAAGRTVRSAVDGIYIDCHHDGSSLLLVQHTITARNGLRQKWLNDKNGDVVKAKAIFKKEIARNSIQNATLILTSTSDPDELLIRDINAAVGDGLKVDLWAASRIADFLDRNPEGQWLREQQFGTDSTRISVSQARAISKQSLNNYLPLVARGDTVPRALDVRLAEFALTRRGAGFVIGESGLGKSTALRRLADNWILQGGIALVLAHEIIEKASNIEQAVTLGLRHWAPALDVACGRLALAFATPEQPLLLIVEDVNQSTNPRRIVEQLVGWSIVGKSDADSGMRFQCQWCLLCPVWRGNACLSDIHLRDHVIGSSLMVEGFERSEAMSAIEARSSRAGVKLTALQRNDLAMSLGDDPLLIGLNQNWLKPSAQGAIESYLIANIDEVADENLLATDLQQALDRLLEKLVEAREIYPEWSEIRNWFSAEGDTLGAIRRLIGQGRIIRLGIGLARERLMYRHDRVRDHLLSQAIARLIISDRLTPELWAEPFYAEILGGALLVLPKNAIDKVVIINPAALFAALQNTRIDEIRRSSVIEAAKRWFQSPGFKLEAFDQQRHHSMHFLARTDGAFTVDLAKAFPASFPKLEALVRNGDVRAGASLCATFDPSVNHPWRDRIIAHALSRHANFVPDLAELICDNNLSPELLEGALNLAGEIGDPVLCNALAERWSCGDEKSLSTGWLWASLRCCSPVGHSLANTLCDLWAKLPIKIKHVADKVDSNPRWDIAGYSLPWAFRRKPEQSAISFLVARAKRDRRLFEVLSSILAKVDSPDAVLYSVALAAKISRRVEKNGGINLFTNNILDAWSPERHGRALSVQSRSTIELVWRNQRINRFERKSAFLVWSQTPTPEELATFSTFENDPVLADIALRARLALSDQSAVPLLRNRIWSDKHGKYWWQNARRIGLAGLHEDIHRYFDERRSGHMGDGNNSDSDHIVSELLMDARDEFAAQAIVANWEQLEKSPLFVQAALYLATPDTVLLARSAIVKSGYDKKMMQFIDMRWGIKHNGRMGVTDRIQLQVLEPYYGLMDAMPIISFFEAANELGELEWREKHLDPLVAKLGYGYCTSDKESLFASLDNELSNYNRLDRPRLAIYHWFKRREKELRKRKELLAIISEWTFLRASEPAVALLCSALLHFGDRSDLDLLSSIPDVLQASCSEMVKDCIYGVKKRSLSRAYQES